jgi:purine-binding chemotaxis protein CheW
MAASASVRVLLFGIGGQRFALALDAVERVLRAVELTPLPGAPPTVAGAIDVHGAVVPVFNLRERLGLAACEVSPSDVFILARAGTRRVALWCEFVQSVAELSPEALTDAERIAPRMDGVVAGVARLPDGLALVEQLDRFLSVEDEAALDRALATP